MKPSATTTTPKKKRTHTLHKELKTKIAVVQTSKAARAEATRALCDCVEILNTKYVPKRRNEKGANRGRAAD